MPQREPGIYGRRFPAFDFTRNRIDSVRVRAAAGNPACLWPTTPPRAGRLLSSRLAKWFGAFSISAAILVGTISNYPAHQHSSPALFNLNQAAPPPVLAPPLAPRQDDDAAHDCPSRNLSSPAPRAELVSLPVRRAILVRLPHRS
jgi:hypothetical protein